MVSLPETANRRTKNAQNNSDKTLKKNCAHCPQQQKRLFDEAVKIQHLYIPATSTFLNRNHWQTPQERIVLRNHSFGISPLGQRPLNRRLHSQREIDFLIIFWDPMTQTLKLCLELPRYGTFALIVIMLQRTFLFHLLCAKSNREYLARL
jgi:hypothetical protein